MRDNTLVAALSRRGVDIQLVPTYTPIRTDEVNTTQNQVFMGGVNVYLQQRVPLLRSLPRIFDRWLDSPGLIRWATRKTTSMRAEDLGALTVSMLKGEAGFQRKEVERLVDWLVSSARPELLNLSNILIAGFVRRLKQELGIPVLVTLQGDDIFLEGLPEPHKSDSLRLIRDLVQHIDGFLVFSEFYAQKMGSWFEIPPEKIHLVPMGVDLRDVERSVPTIRSGPRKVGYFARLAPEKGLHVLVDAFLELRSTGRFDDVELQIAGWLGEHRRGYVDEQFAKLNGAGLGDAYHYAGELDRPEKFEFLAGLDLFSVPTTYQDPKGIFVLEALAAGVPVVQPDHGSFPELLELTGGGRLVRPDDSTHLAEGLAELLDDPASRQALGAAGQQAVHEQCHADAMAEATLRVYQRVLKDGGF